MWVSPAVRGLGLGRRLLAELEAVAAARGVRALRLETNQTLTPGPAVPARDLGRKPDKKIATNRTRRDGFSP